MTTTTLVEASKIKGKAVKGTIVFISPLEWLPLEKQPRIYHVAVSSGTAPHTAYCVELPSAVSEGQSKTEAMEKLEEAFQLVTEDYVAEGKDVPWTKGELEEGFEIAGTVSLDG